MLSRSEWAGHNLSGAPMHGVVATERAWRLNCLDDAPSEPSSQIF